MQPSFDEQGFISKVQGRFGYGRNVSLTPWQGKAWLHVFDSSKCIQDESFDKTKRKNISMKWEDALKLRDCLSNLDKYAQQIEREQYMGMPSKQVDEFFATPIEEQEEHTPTTSSFRPGSSASNSVKGSGGQAIPTQNNSDTEPTSLTAKKRALKNIYCSSCGLWVSEFYFSCHINSILHEKRFNKQSVENQLEQSNSYKDSDEESVSLFQRVVGTDAMSSSTDSIVISSKDSVIDSEDEHYSIQGSTLTDREDADCSSPVLFSTVNQSEFEEEQLREKEKLDSIPQNQLGIPSFNFYTSVYSDDEESTQTDFPLSLLSGTFPSKPCGENHDNEISEKMCEHCNPDSYNTYDDW